MTLTKNPPPPAAVSPEYTAGLSDLPPPYTPTSSTPSSPSTVLGQPPPLDHDVPLRPPSANASPPPSNAQRARSPLAIHTNNEPITGNYLLLDVSSAKTPPDAVFTTTNNRINVGIWVEGEVERQVEIQAKSTNGVVTLRVNTLVSTQPVSISARSTNSNVQLALPSKFHGVLTVSTTNNKCELSPELLEKSIRLGNDKHQSGVRYEVGGRGGKSEAFAKTTNARVDVGFTSD